MVAVRKMESARGLTLTEVEVPKPGPADLLVKIKACSLCGTDVHIYNWDPPFSQGRLVPPKTLGHELCGEIVEIGSAVRGDFEIGDQVSAESHVACGTCWQCMNGNQHICQNIKFLGVDIDGSFAQYMALPAANAWKVPKSMPPEWASVQESFGNSVYTVEESRVSGKNVAIFGTGPTGLWSIMLCKLFGASLIAVVAGSEFHIKLAKQLGADAVINRHEQDVVKELKGLTNGVGFDVCLEMSGAGQALDHALKAVRACGQVSILGLPSKRTETDWSKDIVLKDLTIRGIYGRRMWQTWTTATNIMRSGKLDISPGITHRLPLEKFEEAINLASSGQAGKIVMLPPRS